MPSLGTLWLLSPLLVGAGLLLAIASSSPRVWRLSGSVRPPDRLLLLAEALTVALTAPVLWFPSVRPELVPPVILLLALSWAAGALAGTGLWPRSRLDLPLLLLLLMAGLGAALSPYVALTQPKVTALLLGLAIYRLILRAVRAHGAGAAAGSAADSGRSRSGRAARLARALSWVVLGVLALALGLAVVGLLNGMRSDKHAAVAQFLARLPRALYHLPDAQGGTASANQLAGALLLVWPLGAALAFCSSRRLRPSQRGVAGAAALLLLGALLLTQSRSAWAGALVAAGLLVALRWPWGRWVILALLIAALAWWLVAGRAQLQPQLAAVLLDARGPRTAVGALSLAGRLQIWERAARCILGSPWLGCGLATFRLLDGNPAAANLADTGTPHAHSALLQVGYDLGLPGLIAYLALLALQLWVGWRGLRGQSRFGRSLAIGLLCALVGYHLYGIGDCVAIGAKPGVLWWCLLAVTVGLDDLLAASAPVRRGHRPAGAQAPAPDSASP